MTKYSPRSPPSEATVEEENFSCLPEPGSLLLWGLLEGEGPCHSNTRPNPPILCAGAGRFGHPTRKKGCIDQLGHVRFRR